MCDVLIFYHYFVLCRCVCVFCSFVCLDSLYWIHHKGLRKVQLNFYTCAMFHNHEYITKQHFFFSLSGWHCFLWAVVTGIPSWCHYWYGCVHQKTIDSKLWFGQISQNMELWSMVRHYMVTVHFIKMKLINNLWQFKVSLHYTLPKNMISNS